MPIIGYGEDGLTAWAVTHRLADILKALDDPTAPTDCLVFFWPSFGRAGGMTSPQFGEFDSIVVTDTTIYLVESKWDGSPSVLDGLVFLEPRQILRHRIFRWIAERWPASGSTWGQFRAAHEGEFQMVFSAKPLAPVGSRLARNLEFVMNRLVEGNMKVIRDVLLYFYHGQAAPAGGVIAEAGDFRLVSLRYEPLAGSTYFEMQ